MTDSVTEELMAKFAEILGPMTSASKLRELAEAALEIADRWAAEEPDAR